MDTKTGFNHVYENIYYEALDRKCLSCSAGFLYGLFCPRTAFASGTSTACTASEC